jgi:radical SAM protein with 4Fe4S-binding SPASM domain
MLKQMLLLFRLAEKLFGAGLVVPLRLLTGGSFTNLRYRIGRIQRIARSMATGGSDPPLPVRFQVETTDICNLKCRMCTREVIDGMNTRSMPLADFERLIVEVDPYYVTLNGLGEPLIDKTIFGKLAFLRRRGILTSMPTNGTYIRREKLDKLAENLPDILQMSIDGATKESFEQIRVRGDFARIVANYRSILDRRNAGAGPPGVKMRILCALQKKNLFDYREMFALVRSMPGLDAFELVPVFDYDAEGTAFVELVPSREDVLALHGELDRATVTATSDEEAAFYRRWKAVSGQWLDPAAATVAPESNTHACLIPWFNAYVDVKGRVFPCCFLSNSGHLMGNVYDRSFAEIWHGEAYRSFRARMLSDRPNMSGCRTCPRNDDGRVRQLMKMKPLLSV